MLGAICPPAGWGLVAVGVSVPVCLGQEGGAGKSGVRLHTGEVVFLRQFRPDLRQFKPDWGI